MTNTIFDLRGKTAFLNGSEVFSNIENTFYNRLLEKNLDVILITANNISMLEAAYAIKECSNLVLTRSGIQQFKVLFNIFPDLNYKPDKIILIDSQVDIVFEFITKKLYDLGIKFFKLNLLDFDYIDEFKPFN